MHEYVRLAYEVIKSELFNNYLLDESYFINNNIFNKKRGSFVTIHNFDDSLRGCIGTIEPYYENLYYEILNNAKAAAFNDPRFPKIQKDEFKNLKINVDVLSELIKVKNLGELNPKKYGIVLKKDYKRGVLLPDLEDVNTIEQQIYITKRKAGIFSDDFDIYKFTVERHR